MYLILLTIIIITIITVIIIIIIIIIIIVTIIITTIFDVDFNQRYRLIWAITCIMHLIFFL